MENYNVQQYDQITRQIYDQMDRLMDAAHKLRGDPDNHKKREEYDQMDRLAGDQIDRLIDDARKLFGEQEKKEGHKVMASVNRKIKRWRRLITPG